MRTVTAHKVFALLAALLLTTGEYLLLDHDARQRQAAFQPAAASVSAPRG